MNSVIVANALCAAGVAFLLIGHYFVSIEKFNKGYGSAAAGGVFVMVGSAILASWSVVFLNLIWVYLSLSGMRRLKDDTSASVRNESLSHYLAKLLPIAFVVGIVLSVTGYDDLAAWACTVIYLLGYWLLTTKRIGNPEYMLWTFLGFFLLINHLVDHHSYSVLANETIGAVISLRGLLGYVRSIPEKNVEPTESVAQGA